MLGLLFCFCFVITQLGAAVSMSRAGECYDNAVAERFVTFVISFVKLMAHFLSFCYFSSVKIFIIRDKTSGCKNRKTDTK